MLKAHRRNLYSLAFYSLSCIPAALLLGMAGPVACTVFAALLLWSAHRSVAPAQQGAGVHAASPHRS